MSGALSVPLSVAAYFVQNDNAKIALFLTAIACFAFASFRIWRAERLKVLALEAQIADTTNSRAALRLEIGGEEPYRIEKDGWINWKMAIRNDGPAVAERVSVQLVSITPAPNSSQIIGLLDYPLTLNTPEFGDLHIKKKGLEYFGICNAVSIGSPMEWSLNGIGRGLNSTPRLNISWGHKYWFEYSVEAANADGLSFTLIVTASAIGVSVSEKL